MAQTKQAPARRRKPASKPQEEVNQLIKAEGTVAVGSVIALTIILALGSFTLSFGALEQLASAAAVTPQVTWLWPIIVDGFIVLATVASYVLRNREHGATRRYPWFALILFAVISVAGNAYHAYLNVDELLVPVWVAALVNSAPAVALLLASHLLVIMLQTPRKKKEPKLSAVTAAGTPAETVSPAPHSAVAPQPKTLKEQAAQPLPITGDNNELNPDNEQPLFSPPADETKKVRTAVVDESLTRWALERVSNSDTLTSGDITEFLGEGTSLRTGQRKLKNLREQNPAIEEYVNPKVAEVV